MWLIYWQCLVIFSSCTKGNNILLFFRERCLKSGGLSHQGADTQAFITSKTDILWLTSWGIIWLLSWLLSLSAEFLEKGHGIITYTLPPSSCSTFFSIKALKITVIQCTEYWARSWLAELGQIADWKNCLGLWLRAPCVGGRFCAVRCVGGCGQDKGCSVFFQGLTQPL